MATKIVAILNITPDSFSDGGKYNSLQASILQVRRLIAEGADVIDIGAESTRPNAQPITPQEEWARLKDILPEIVKETKVAGKLVSIDTRYYETAAKAVAFGVDIINDVSGLSDVKMMELIAKNNVLAVFMHSLSVPANPDIIINKNLNVVDEIIKWAREKIKILTANGIKKEQLIFDAGIGFSKDAAQSITILKNIDDFKVLDLPIYIGHSKKSFLDEIGEKNQDRAQKTLEISKYLASRGVDFIRVHDVLANKKAISF